ncbi:MAG: RNA methyltransferase [Defluviitaleaceae bacterium]|nr:RNA methyltransferase [Defluviitaleaceae bacterium]
MKNLKKLREENLFIVEGEKFISEIPKNYTIRQYFFTQKFAETHDISAYKNNTLRGNFFCEKIRDNANGKNFCEKIRGDANEKNFCEKNCDNANEKNFCEKNCDDANEKKIPCDVIRDSYFNALADTVSPQGIIAVCEKISYSLEEILRGIAFPCETDARRGENRESCTAFSAKPSVNVSQKCVANFFLLCESLSDPGNVGALLRTAAAAGASGAIFTRGSCDVFSPKVIRASAGAALRLPIIENADTEEILRAVRAANFEDLSQPCKQRHEDTLPDAKKNFSVPIYAAHPRGNFLPYEINFREKFCLLLGNESRGLTRFAKQNATALVRLPMTNATESLNVSVAGSILMYEAVRQRGNF